MRALKNRMILPVRHLPTAVSCGAIVSGTLTLRERIRSVGVSPTILRRLLRDCLIMHAGFRSVGVSPTPLRSTGFQPVQVAR
ncbi:MAG: hypothetical protein NZ556_06475, partial [Fimbriimonadales bacterium]|nr:hypothetical protein [Fimbriimonadales bacterium]